MQEYLSSISSNIVYEKIYSAALKLLYQLTPEKTYATIVNEAKKLVDAKHGTIFLVEKDTLKRVYATSPILYEITPRESGFTSKVYKKNLPYLLSKNDLLKLHPEFKKLNVGSDIGVPLTYSNKTIGVLAVFSKNNITFTQEDLSILRIFSPLVSLAVRNIELYSEAKKSLEERDLFISMAAHELKTPLTTASIYSQLLLRKISNTKYSETQIKMKLSNEITRLTNLVNELLQVNQIKTGSLKFIFKKCDLCSVVEGAITAFENIYKDNPINFKNELKNRYCFVKGDFDKLFQVVINLLNNAAKFSPKKSPIDILLTYEDSKYILEIRDYGPGINKKDLPQIFERFYKGAGKKRDGLGLGLFLVRNVIDKHRGEIFVSSKRTQGTTFSIVLPMYNMNE